MNDSKMIDSKLKTYPILNIKFKQAFEQLSQEERIFTYYIYRACVEGAPIVLFNLSYESPALFVIFQSFFSSFKPFEDAKKKIFLNTMYIINNNITEIKLQMWITKCL